MSHKPSRYPKLDKARAMVAKFPNTNKTQLGNLLYKKNKALYIDAEDARKFVRKATGALGAYNRKKILPLAKQEHYPNGKIYNPYGLPEQKHNDFSFYKIVVTPDTRIGLISDIHIPYQDNVALTAALDFLRKQNLTHLIIDGDLMDCYQLSSYDKDPSGEKISSEIKKTRKFLEMLVKQFPGVKIIYKEGNHEQRLIRYLLRKAPELFDMEILTMRKLLGLSRISAWDEPALPIDHVPDHKLIQAGHLMVIHGHEFGHQMMAPVNPARGYFLKAKTNVIGGDKHQTSSHSENRLDGKPTVAYSIGHLADPHPLYRPVNNWNHGFALITHVQDQKSVNFVVNNYKIINGKIY